MSSDAVNLTDILGLSEILTRTKRRVVFTVDFECCEAEMGALVVAEMLHQHAEDIEAAAVSYPSRHGAAGTSASGVSTYPEGTVSWVASPPE